MRVAIDLTSVQRRVTGCDRYVLELVGGLAAVDAETEYVLFLNRHARARWVRPLPANFRTVVVPACARATRLAFQQALLPLWLRHLGVQVLHSPSFFAPLGATRTRHVVTVHDLTFFTLPQVHNRFRRSHLFRQGIRASIRRADLVVVPSRATARDVQRLATGLAADAIRVVSHGVASPFVPRAPETVAPTLGRLGIRKPYLLHVGTLEPRKNLEVLLDAFRRVLADGRLDLDLVLAGKTGWGCEDLLRRLAAPELAGRVHRLGHVSDDDLAALYSGARLFVFPSAYEGFGLPPIEAMACGAPIVASSAGALAETLAGAAVLVDPSATAVHAAVTRVLQDPTELGELRAAGLERAAQFRWESTARATRACYEELAR